MRKSIKSIVAFSLACVMLTSCGNHFDAPQLMDPVSAVDPYYTVTRGNVGNINVMMGTVSARPYCHFWKTRVGIQEIKVEVGQYVKAGDVLAVADYEMAQQESSNIQNEISRVQSIYNQTAKKYDVMEEEYEYTLKGAKEIGDKATEKETTQKLKELEECRKYDKALCGIRVAGYNKELEEIQKVMKDTNLVAEHEGFVTYAKDIDASNIAGKEDNVVVVSDYNDRYIESVLPGGVRLKPYETVYVTDGKTRHDLKELEYSENELMIATNKQLMITRRYVYKDGGKLPDVGKQMLMIQKHESADNVIVIDKSYLFEDEEGTYVYVMKDGASEKRYITIGLADVNMREVKSGLEEGEKVYAKGNMIMPTAFSEYTAEVGNIQVTERNNKILIDNRKADVTKFYGSGVVEKIVTDGERVKKGEVICKIATDEGGAVLNEMRVGIERARDGHDKENEMYDEQIKELKKKLNKLKDSKKNTQSKKTETTSKEKDKKEGAQSDETVSQVPSVGKEETITTESVKEDMQSPTSNMEAVPDSEQSVTLQEKGTMFEKMLHDDVQIYGIEEIPNTEGLENAESTESTEGAEIPTQEAESTFEEMTDSTTATEAVTQATTEQKIEEATQATSEQKTDATTETEKKEQNTNPEKPGNDKQSDSKDSKKPEEEKPMNPYQKEILECQIREVEIDKEISQIDFNFSMAQMERSYNDMMKGNDGSGEKTFIAQEDCVIRKTYCSRGDQVGYGDRVFSIVKEGNPKVMIKNKDHYALNQSVEIIEDGSVKYKGKIISDTSYSGSYITTKDNEVFITHNTEESQMSYYMASDDQNLYTDNNKKDARIVTQELNGVILPSRAVYVGSRMGESEIKYVWKKVDDSWNMQIITAEYLQVEDAGFYIVLDGVSENDVLAMQD